MKAGEEFLYNMNNGRQADGGIPPSKGPAPKYLKRKPKYLVTDADIEEHIKRSQPQDKNINDFECMICEDLIYAPIECTQCNTLYCQSCIIKWI